MNAARIALAGALAALFTFVSAGVAQAYPDPTITIDLSDARFVGGLDFDYTVTSSDVDCEWAVTYGGETQEGDGTSISGTFGTPKVSAEKDTTLTATCTYDDTAEVSPSAVASGTATVTLLPQGVDTNDQSSNGVLPDTGGSNLWILVAGAALVLGGGGAVVASRRRS